MSAGKMARMKYLVSMSGFRAHSHRMMSKSNMKSWKNASSSRMNGGHSIAMSPNVPIIWNAVTPLPTDKHAASVDVVFAVRGELASL